MVCITITEPKKRVGLREQFISVTGTEKYWSGLSTFFIQIKMFQKVQLLNA